MSKRVGEINLSKKPCASLRCRSAWLGLEGGTKYAEPSLQSTVDTLLV